jgi:hypothetical protein
MPDPLPILRCRRTDTPPPLDGLLDRAPWRDAEAAALRMYDGAPPSYRTLVRALWTDAELHVAFECEDPEPAGTMTRRDDALFNDGNVVEVFLDPAGAGQTYFEFEVNPLGTIMDLFYDRLDRNWREAVKWDAPDARTAVRIERDAAGRPVGWCAQLAVPFANFHTAPRRPPAAGDVWRVNFYRYNTVSTLPGDDKLELYAWSPTMEKRFDLPARFGTLVFDR